MSGNSEVNIASFIKVTGVHHLFIVFAIVIIINACCLYWKLNFVLQYYMLVFEINYSVLSCLSYMTNELC